MDGGELLTIGPCAVAAGVQEGHLRRLCRAGLIPFRVVNRARVFDPADIHKIRAAAAKAGYLRDAHHINQETKHGTKV